MSKSKRQIKISKEKRIKELREELANNDTIYKDSHEKLTGWVDRYLAQKHHIFHHAEKQERLTLDIEEAELKLSNGFTVLNPIFSYQNDKRYPSIMERNVMAQIKVLRSELTLIKDGVKEITDEIMKQRTRIIERRQVILEELEKSGEDITGIPAIYRKP